MSNESLPEFSRLLAEQVLRMDLITPRGVQARELARKVLDLNEEESPAEGALRRLASWLGAGGYNAPTVDAKVFEEKIRWGVENHASSAGQAFSLDDKAAELLKNTIGSDDYISPVTLSVCNGRDGRGLYVWLTEYPEEGSILLAASEQNVEAADQDVA